MNTFKQKRVSSLAPSRPPGLHPQAGLSLVELMVAMTVGLMLVAGVTTLIVQQSNTSTELEKASRQIENGRYATQVMRDDIQLAGYFGDLFRLSDPAALAAPCTTTATGADSLEEGMSLPIQGYDSPATVPAALSCLASGNHVPGTDILVLRRTDTTAIPIASAAAGQPYLQTGLDNTNALTHVVGTGSDTSVFTLIKKDGTAAPLRRLLTHIYFVSPCHIPASGDTCNGTSDDNGTPIPTLKRLELTVSGGVAGFSIVPIAEGIQNLQLDYGLDADGDGAPESYSAGTYSSGTTPMTHLDWANVMTIRVNTLARNLEPTANHEDSKSYQLGDFVTVSAANDAYKRRVFTEVVRAINPAGRRAK